MTLSNALSRILLFGCTALTLAACGGSDSRSELALVQPQVSGGSVSLTVSSGSATFNGGGASAPVAVDPNLALTGTATTLDGAVMSIGSGFVTGQDLLNYSNIGSITGSYDSTRGTLTLSGTDSLANYQTALRSVTYSNSSATPTAGSRAVSISVGTAVSNPDNGHFYEFVSFTGTWTQANADVANRSYLGLQGYLVTITSASENAFIKAKLSSDGWIGAQTNTYSFPRTWSWVGGPEAGEAFCNNTAAGACSTLNALYVNWATGEPNNSGSNEGCGQIYFSNAGKWNDLNCNGGTLPGYVAEYGGSTTDPSVVLSGSRTVNVIYTATAIATTPGTLTYTAGDAATVVDPGVAVSGSSTFTSATVTLSSGYVSSQDVLALGSSGTITGSYTNGVLTLTGTGTAADYQAAFQQVTYTNTVSPLPTTAVRTVRFAIGSANASRNLQVKSLSTVTVTSSSPSRGYRQSLTLTATLSPSSATGTVGFFDGTTSLGTATISGGVASLSAPNLTLGSHTIAANYAGDTQRSRTSGTFVQTITPMAAGQGPCTTGEQATVCASAECNATTSTCGNDVGGVCTSASQCSDNICGGNGQCGKANGDACTSPTASQCQSGACSASAHTCIPQGGCATNSDCSPGFQCNTSLACEVAPGIQTSTGVTAYNAQGADVAVDPSISVVGAQNISGGTVTIGSGFSASQDKLLFTNANGISGTYNSANGVLTLTGSATTAAYQAALRTVIYRNLAGALPDTTLRTVTFGLGTAVANSANGHFYEFVSSAGTWTTARTAAAARTYLGLHGYLATITSSAENDFIKAKLTNDGWIGAQASPQNSFPRVWSWVTGPETGTAICNNPSAGNCTAVASAFTNWNPGEPNNAGGEGCGQIYFAQAGRWNDLPCTGTSLAGYVAEYGGSSNDTAINLSASKNLQIVAAPSVAVSSSKSSVNLGDTVTLTAKLNSASATGTVQFLVDGLAIGSPVSLSGGMASLDVSTLAVGAHTLSAQYSGDPQNQSASGSSSGVVQVNPFANGTGHCDASTAATDCSSGVCSGTGTCGYAVTEGPCIPGKSSAVCQSGTCSAGKVCVPPGGCSVDDDCGSTQYCSRANLTCVAKGAPGAPLPNDGNLHNGVCTPDLAAAACATAACNTITNTCSAANGQDCTGANACSSNICGSNGKCGRVSGEGPCTSANGATSCQSGFCNPTANGSANACVPSQTSCWVDGDCASDHYCARDTFTCTAKLTPGQPIPSDSLHPACSAESVSAFCSTGLCNAQTNTCAGGNGSPCSSVGGCVTGVCGSNGKCGLENGTPGCTADTAALCQSGFCTPSGSCAPGVNGCALDTDCLSGQFCEHGSLTCVAQLLTGTAIPSDGLHDGLCDAISTPACASGACNSVTNTCSSSNGTLCGGTNQCTNNICGNNGQCGHADGEPGCTPTDASSCQSQHCSVENVCVPQGASGCWVDADCGATQFCQRDLLTCVSDVISGSPIPNDTLHPGYCTTSVAQAVCASAACNPAKNTCANHNGESCSIAADCIVDVCGDNGECGIIDGQGVCSQSTAVRCQSATCSISGTCTSATGCWVDADCGSGTYCNRDTAACVALGLPGTPIAKDAVHDGQCTQANAQLLCASGECNVATNTCSAKNQQTCAAAEECTTNVCGQDGKCGQVDGTACTTDAVCRSACVNHKCSPSDAANLSSGGGCSATGNGTWSVLALLAVGLFCSRKARSNVRRSALVAVAVILSVVAVQNANAQTSGAAISTFRPAAAGSDWFSTDSLDFRGDLRPSARVMVDWGHDPLLIRNEDGSRRGTPVQNHLFFDVGASLNLFSRVRIFANLPIAAYQNGFESRLGGVELKPGASGGLGDFAYGADLRLFGEYGSPFTMALGLALTAPTGSRKELLGDGTSTYMPRILAAGQSGLFVWAAQFGFNFRSAAISSVDFGNEVRAALSGGVRFNGGQWMVGPEFFAVLPAGQAHSGRTGGIEGDIGAHYRINPEWKVGAGIGTGLERAAGIPDLRLVGSVDWSPAIAKPVVWVDTDRDGIPDRQDVCPEVRGDRDHQGCPPDPDTDHDGLLDGDDRCPSVSGGPTPDPQRPGCPLPPDQDADGLPNSLDACPTQKPGALPDLKRPGCPLADRDEDGVPDDLDACPDAKGAASDDAKRSGCPVPALPALIELEPTQIRPLKPVSFAKNQDTLLESSNEVLQAVADTLKARPEIKRISVEGHSDTKGKRAANERLSERRAEAVMKWLVANGIAAERMEAHGFGPNRPLIQEEKTEADRATNRRVEFIIVR